VSAVVGLAFFTPGKGLTPFDRLLDICRRLAGMGIDRQSLAASSGMADPRQVADSLSRLRAELPPVRFGLHLHNRNGMALANALAGMLAGAQWLEGSILGIGGDAWFPGDLDVLGNAPMEDLVNLTTLMGVSTGVDLDRYLDASRMAQAMLGRKSAAFVVRGGTRAALTAHQWES
jgi:hydroxymethylglutaryl-CoA lyase